MTSVFPYALSYLFFICKTFFQFPVYIFLFSVYLAFGAILPCREKEENATYNLSKIRGRNKEFYSYLSPFLALILVLYFHFINSYCYLTNSLKYDIIFITINLFRKKGVMSMKKAKVAIALGLCMTILGGNVCYAASAADIVLADAVQDGLFLSDHLTQENKDFLNKLSTIYDEFELSDNGILSLKSPLSEIQAKANFNDAEMENLRNLLDFNKVNPVGEKDTVMPRIHVSGWKIYLTQSDVQTFLAGAAAVGPAAIIAALSALGSTVPGVGTVIGAILGVVAAGDLCYLVLQAISANKGIYIGVEWNGIVPSYTQGLW